MDFVPLVSRIKELLNSPLPGREAQLKMAPYSRIPGEEALKTVRTIKLSAVLILLFPIKEKAYLLLMQRPSYDGHHSGQICFPGGKKDATDETLEQTALREASEEVGVSASEVEVLGKLTSVYIPTSNYYIEPYLALYKEKPDLILDPKEVQSAILMPLSKLIEKETSKTGIIEIPRTNLKLKSPYFEIDGHVVWGATAMMLSELKEMVKKVKSYEL